MQNNKFYYDYANERWDVMPLEIVRNDITNIKTRDIVNSGNPKAVIGYKGGF